ncbi:hypothetical protein QVD17_38356 [Tagetes erecta]|uniref:Uncharacterized protein n=1 Tax=Tagetes erecta TaxID=13708 RepID=A0AAD8JN10_TARER|nr:hypothetical protein QVD17_38356 [Tagetes erecta]
MPTHFLLHFVLFILYILNVSFATRRLTELLPNTPNILKYHNGPLLAGNISVNLVWYGNFKPFQKSIISDFVTSLSSTLHPQPSVATWWKTTDNYHTIHTPRTKLNRHDTISIRLGKQVSDPKYSLGKSLTNNDLVKLVSKLNIATLNAVNVVLTANDVAVTGFCSSRCGTHGSAMMNSKTALKFVYIWVGNSDTQCRGQCAWPFHQPIYGPQGASLVAPNNDVGLDGMVINLASLMAGAVTNPFGNGFYQGDASAPLEAASTCTGVYAKGAYPGYPGDLLIDPTTGASYNAYGVNGRKYLVPALYDPFTSKCFTLV